MSGAPITVTVDDLKAATWGLASHLNNGSKGHHYTYRSPAFPELMVCKGWGRKASGVPDSYAVMQISVGGGRVEELPLNDHAAIAARLTKVRQAIADDEAWEAADPARRAAT